MDNLTPYHVIVKDANTSIMYARFRLLAHAEEYCEFLRRYKQVEETTELHILDTCSTLHIEA